MIPRAVTETIVLFTLDVTSVCPPITCTFFSLAVSSISCIIFFISSSLVPTGQSMVTVIAKGSAPDAAISLRLTSTESLPIFSVAPVIGSEDIDIILFEGSNIPQS